MVQNELIQSQLNELECMESCDRESFKQELMQKQKQIKTSKDLYYDKKEDDFWKENYYRDLSINMFKPKHLFDDLHRLVTTTHHNKLPYYISKDQFLYTWVDLHPNGT